MWVRGAVFDHGVPHVHGSLVGGWVSAEPGAASSGGAEAKGWRVGRPAFQALGRLVTALRARGLGRTLAPLLGGELGATVRVADALSTLLFDSARELAVEAARDGHAPQHPSQSHCTALADLFCTIASVDARFAASVSSRTVPQCEGELALFLLVQVWHEARLAAVGKETIDVWQSEQQQQHYGGEPAAAVVGAQPGPGTGSSDASAESRSPRAGWGGLGLSLDTLDPPSLTTPPGPSSPRSQTLELVAQESEHRLGFLKTHVREICWLLSLCTADAPVAKAVFVADFDSRTLPYDVAEALRLLVDDSRQREAGGSGALLPFDRTAGARVSCAAMEQALLRSLELNAENNPVLSRTSRSSAEQLDAPACGLRAGGAIIAHVHRRTTVLSDEGEQPVVMDSAVVFDCSHATVYLLRASMFVRIVGCSRCVIVLAPCSGIVTVEQCHKVTIVGVAAQFAVHNSYDLELHVHAALAPPVLSGDCRNIVLGPFHTHYPRLLVHLAAARLQPADLAMQHDDKNQQHQVLSLWARPNNLTGKAGRQVWSLLPAEDLGLFVTPFAEPPPPGALACSENPFRLPPAYAAALGARVRVVEGLMQRVAAASPPPRAESKAADEQHEQKKQRDQRKLAVERAIEGAFRDWLISSGNHRQVLDLVKLGSSGASGAGTAGLW
jgi:hypothetical protein